MTIFLHLILWGLYMFNFLYLFQHMLVEMSVRTCDIEIPHSCPWLTLWSYGY